MEYKIGELFDIKAAGDLKKENFSKIKTNKFKYPLYGNALEKEGLMGYSNNKKYNSTITVTGRGDIGKAFVRNHDFDAVGRLLILNKKGNVNLEFVTEYINNKLRIYLESTGVPQLTAPQFKSYKIKLPSLSEQNKLGLFFNLINEKIMLLEKTYSLYSSFLKQVLNDLMCSKLYFDNDDLIECKVSEFLSESKIKSKDDINKRLSVKLNLKGIYKREPKAIEKEGSTTQYLRKAGQFIYGKQNLHNGAFGLIPKELDGFLSSNDIPSFDFKNNINPKWFYYYFSRKNFYKKLERLSTGTGSKRISPDEFLKIKIKVPSSKEQQKIVYLLNSINNQINLIIEKINNLNLFKKEMLNKLFI